MQTKCPRGLQFRSRQPILAFTFDKAVLRSSRFSVVQCTASCGLVHRRDCRKAKLFSFNWVSSDRSSVTHCLGSARNAPLRKGSEWTTPFRHLLRQAKPPATQRLKSCPPSRIKWILNSTVKPNARLTAARFLFNCEDPPAGDNVAAENFLFPSEVELTAGCKCYILLLSKLAPPSPSRLLLLLPCPD